MVPVDQTVLGFADGNCFAACLASLLEVPLNSIPDFAVASDAGWFPRFRAWLVPQGWYPICFKVDDGWEPPGLYILSGASPRGTDPKHLHSVVAQGAGVLHDPHPSRDGLSSRLDAIVLVPVDPVRPEWRPTCTSR